MSKYSEEFKGKKMTKNTRYLLNYRTKDYSLEGEEGILEYMLDKIPESDRNNFIVEFGAYDGITFSNSLYFIQNFYFEAVEIEADDGRFKQLEINMKPYNVECIKSFITRDGETTLDKILNNSNKEVPRNFDVLVVDVDNNDYHLWKTVQEYRPKIVMIEVNNTVLPTTDKIAEYDAEFIFGKHGSSIKSMTELAEEKGYKLVCNISCNAIYIQKEYFNLFFDYAPSVEDFYTFEGFNVKRWLFELSFQDKLRKLLEAIRRDKVMYKLNNFSAFLSIVKNLFTTRI
jgi:hypothetical protein